jgi:hypothetical protein
VKVADLIAILSDMPPDTSVWVWSGPNSVHMTDEFTVKLDEDNEVLIEEDE